jgi:hypothetical protein
MGVGLLPPKTKLPNVKRASTCTFWNIGNLTTGTPSAVARNIPTIRSTPGWPSFLKSEKLLNISCVIAYIHTNIANMCRWRRYTRLRQPNHPPAPHARSRRMRSTVTRRDWPRRQQYTANIQRKRTPPLSLLRLHVRN